MAGRLAHQCLHTWEEQEAQRTPFVVTPAQPRMAVLAAAVEPEPLNAVDKAVAVAVRPTFPNMSVHIHAFTKC